ncbi:MAG: thermosome subunit beta [Candidatus Pacearchaeota archaeon]
MVDKSDYVLPENSQRYVGKDAQRNNILAARIIAETVKTTLGPKGMDKMLVDSLGNITITNDGATILSEMDVQHPVAKMMVDLAKTQESEAGDGTTSAVMLVGKLLENAEKLLDKKIHPSIICNGYKLACDKAVEFLEELSFEISREEELLKIAQTAMTGKGAEFSKDKLAKIVVEAVKSVIRENNQLDLEDIKIEKQKGESVFESELVKGIVLDREKTSIDMPGKIENAKIAIFDCPLEVKSLDRETRISIDSPEKFRSFIEQEQEILLAIVNKIKEVGANVVFCQKGIDDVVQFLLAKKGIYAVRRIPRSDIQRISKATGGKIVSKVEEITENDLGFAELVEEKKIGEDRVTYITGCKNPKSVSIVIKGGAEQVLEETERALRDALGDVACAVKEQKVVVGGGAIEAELARRLRNFSQKLGGREQLAVEEFANALEFIPITLAENAGLDPLDILTELKVAHDAGKVYFGLNLFSGEIEDCLEKGILEPLKVKRQAISSASDLAIMILRIDDVIASKPSRKSYNEKEEILD